MHVALVSVTANPLAPAGIAGSAHVHVAELCAALANRGHRVTVYTRRDDPDMPELGRHPGGYDVVAVPAGPVEALSEDAEVDHIGEFARFLEDRWERERPDVVHAHYWLSGVAAQLAAKRHDVPTVQTFHTLGAVTKRLGPDHAVRPERIKLETLLAKSATWVTASSSDEVFELIRAGRARSRISVVPSGVDVDRFTPVGPAADKGARHRIVSAGKLAPSSGFATLVAALPALPETELVLVGGPPAPDGMQGGVDDLPEARRLIAMATAEGVADRVHLLGRIPHGSMPDILRSADIVACMSQHESFGLLALEAMACGRPVIASAVGGMVDTVVDGVTGRLVAPREPVTFAAVANEILRSDFFARGMGSAGRDRACSRYGWDRVASDMERVYTRIILPQNTFEDSPACASGDVTP